MCSCLLDPPSIHHAMSQEAFLYDAIRTPRGKGRPSGALHGLSPLQLLTTLLKALQARCALETATVDDLILGCVTPIGEQGGNLARTALLAAGWAITTPGLQLNRFCASGLEAINLAAMQVRAGWADLVVAGGVESMSRVPMGADGGPLFEDPTVREQIGFVPQGIGADLIATLEGFRRTQLDEVALRSQQQAAQAMAQGYFGSMIPMYDQAGQLLLAQDEHPRPDTTLEKLAALPPAFADVGAAGCDAVALRKYPTVTAIHHLHTAGNSSGIVDGAALALIGSAAAGAALGLKPRARIVAAATVGSEPTIMLTGPAPATRKALRQAALTLRDLDLIEVNEAFAAVVLKFVRDLELPDCTIINVNGGAIALGHPLGATGAMLVGTALDELERRDGRRALVTLCAGGGMGIATVLERIQ
jgi:acetyl-CoA C-acetyltransferase